MRGRSARPWAKEDPDEDGAGGGAPKWMVTFGDSLTLLLTFFVLMYTFSQPRPQTMSILTRMLAEEQTPGGVQTGSQTHTNLISERKLLRAARANTAGAEKPPLYQELAAGDSAQFPPDLHIDHLEEFGEVLSVRTALKNLLAGNRTAVSDKGCSMLDKVARIADIRPCTVMVRVESGSQSPRDAAMAVQVVRCLREKVKNKFVALRMSPNVQMRNSKLQPGHCEILILAD